MAPVETAADAPPIAPVHVTLKSHSGKRKASHWHPTPLPLEETKKKALTNEKVAKEEREPKRGRPSESRAGPEEDVAPLARSERGNERGTNESHASAPLTPPKVFAGGEGNGAAEGEAVTHSEPAFMPQRLKASHVARLAPPGADNVSGAAAGEGGTGEPEGFVGSTESAGEDGRRFHGTLTDENERKDEVSATNSMSAEGGGGSRSRSSSDGVGGAGRKPRTHSRSRSARTSASFRDSSRARSGLRPEAREADGGDDRDTKRGREEGERGRSSCGSSSLRGSSVRRQPYKVAPCRHYNHYRGCPLGDRCNFLHDSALCPGPLQEAAHRANEPDLSNYRPSSRREHMCAGDKLRSCSRVRQRDEPLARGRPSRSLSRETRNRTFRALRGDRPSTSVRSRSRSASLGNYRGRRDGEGAGHSSAARRESDTSALQTARKERLSSETAAGRANAPDLRSYGPSFSDGRRSGDGSHSCSRGRQRDVPHGRPSQNLSRNLEERERASHALRGDSSVRSRSRSTSLGSDTGRKEGGRLGTSSGLARKESDSLGSQAARRERSSSARESRSGSRQESPDESGSRRLGALGAQGRDQAYERTPELASGPSTRFSDDMGSCSTSARLETTQMQPPLPPLEQQPSSYSGSGSVKDSDTTSVKRPELSLPDSMPPTQPQQPPLRQPAKQESISLDTYVAANLSRGGRAQLPGPAHPWGLPRRWESATGDSPFPGKEAESSRRGTLDSGHAKTSGRSVQETSMEAAQQPGGTSNVSRVISHVQTDTLAFDFDNLSAPQARSVTAAAESAPTAARDGADVIEPPVPDKGSEHGALRRELEGLRRELAKTKWREQRLVGRLAQAEQRVQTEVELRQNAERSCQTLREENRAMRKLAAANTQQLMGRIKAFREALQADDSTGTNPGTKALNFNEK